MKIQQGHYYRFRGTPTIWLVLSVWEAVGDAEIVVLQSGNVASDETKRWPLSQLEQWFSCEVVPSWTDVVAPVVEASDLDFLTGMLDDG